MIVALSLALGAVAVRSSIPAHAALEVVVTSTEDRVGECPHGSNCTLRAAIELVNADDTGVPYSITFDTEVFDPADPQTIALAAALPQVTLPDVTVDASNAGVRIDGSALENIHDGIVLAGERGVVRGLSIHHFAGICITLAGNSSQATGNRVGGCGTGIYANAASSVIRGNVIGFEAGSNNPAGVTFGVVVNATGVEVGDPKGGPATANIIGNSTTAIRIGDALGPTFDGVVVAGNIIGKSPAGNAPAPVGTGIGIRPPSRRTEVLENSLANVTGAAVVVGPNIADISTTGNRILGNRFEGLGGLAIDLGANGVRDDNDAGDADTGPNELLNHPVISRAVQSRIEGSACRGCTVQLYLAAHAPGGEGDYGATPLPGGTLTADASGSFVLDPPPVTPGQWVIAIATDQAGNTSEFGPSARVGAGIAQCGNVALQTGWNLAGYFGQASLPLGNSFPPDGDPESEVTAIYRLVDGTESYLAWFANGGGGRTLNTLEVSEAFWMHAAQPVALAGGFSLTVPLPVTLHAGWNEFVYIGATADVRDALSIIAGKYTAVYRWANAGGDGRWLAYYPELPAWTQGFSEMQSCRAYSIFVTEDVTLMPLQP